MTEQTVSIRPTDGAIDWPETLDRLNKVLRIRTTPIGMKMFATEEEMAAIPKIRRPNDVHDFSTTYKMINQ